METVSTPSTPPIRLIKSPHRSIHFFISTRCGTPPSTRGILSTTPATTASRTRRSGTLLAIRKVLSSTLAFSSEWPSEKARSRDRRTSVWNSCSLADIVATTEAAGREVTEEAKEAFCEKESSSESDDCSSSDVIEPGSDSTRSVRSSPIKIRHVCSSEPHRNVPNRSSRQLLKLSSSFSYPSSSPLRATALRDHTKASDPGPRFCAIESWSTNQSGQLSVTSRTAKRREQLFSASSSSESASPSSPSSSSVDSPIMGTGFCFRLDTLSNGMRTVPGPSLTPSATSEPRAILLPSPTCTPAPMIQLSRTQFGPIATSSKTYALRKMVSGPTEQRAPSVDATTCTSSPTWVEGPMRVLFPILHVLKAKSRETPGHTFWH